MKLACFWQELQAISSIPKKHAVMNQDRLSRNVQRERGREKEKERENEGQRVRERRKAKVSLRRYSRFEEERHHRSRMSCKRNCCTATIPRPGFAFAALYTT